MDIKDLRTKIDSIDDKMSELIKERLDIVKLVREYKEKNGKPINDPTREKEILLRITENASDEQKIYLKRIFENVFEVSKACQTANSSIQTVTAQKICNAIDKQSALPVRARVACQGVHGAYSGIAANKFFELADISYFKTFDAVFTAVEKGFCKYGVLPIENSTAGSVNQVYDLMREHNFYIVGSVRVPITHCLIANPNADINKITEIVSHEQALTQCKNFIEKFPNAKITSCANTAVASEMVRDSGRLDLAAISSRDCAEIYGLKILQSSVQDSNGNFTRFILIAKDLEIYKGADKVSIMTTLPHVPGSLYKTLAKFYNASINVTKLESRPIVGSNFEFTFYFDFECDITNPKVRAVLSELDSSVENFTFLGAYHESIV